MSGSLRSASEVSVLADDYIDPVNNFRSPDNANGVQDSLSSRHLRQLAPLDDISVDFTPGIARRPTLPVLSQVPTPQGSDDEDDKIRIRRTRSQSSEPTESSLSSHSSESEDKTFSDSALQVMAELDTLVGLDDVKSHFQELSLYIHNSQILNIKSGDERYHALFQGNPGTGKTTVAKLYARFLESMGVLESNYVVNTSGATLVSNGPGAIMNILERGDGGVLFVDEAYQLVAPPSSLAGKQVLDAILDEMDSHSSRWVVIFAGYKEGFDLFFAQNDALSSRIPYIFTLQDFSDAQIRSLLLNMFQERFTRHSYTIEGGPNGPFVDSVVRRISQGRARRGSGNWRTVQNHFQRICQRQVRRLISQFDKPKIADRLNFTKEDLLGPAQLDQMAATKIWTEINQLVGLREVKKSISVMFEMVLTNYQRELEGKRPHNYPLNRIFVGKPGTGKTMVAKLYGKILAELGFLSKGDVIFRTSADFIGETISSSKSNTRRILAATLGKVLVIHEAYMLDPGGIAAARDLCKVAVLDSIFAEVQASSFDTDRCILLLGYEDRMQSLFQNGNPGLSSYFLSDMPFRFADYSTEELGQILELNLRASHIDYEPDAVNSAADLLSRYKYNWNFSNARDVKPLISQAVLRNLERHITHQTDDGDFETRLEPQDFDPWLRPQTVSTSNVINYKADLTNQVSDSVIAQLNRYFPASPNRNLNQDMPQTFVLKGPPGTGKKTLATYMGKLFCAVGLLPSNQAVLCSAADFIGNDEEHTATKTRLELEKGFGKLLIVHDIHLLARTRYSSEALDELTSFIGLHSRRMAIVITGLSEPVEELLAQRYALGIMFPDRITFQDLSPQDCLNLLDRLIHDLESEAKTPFFTSQAATERFQKAISIITMLEGPKNAPLIMMIRNRMIQKGTDFNLARTQDPGEERGWKLTEDIAMSCLKTLFYEIFSTCAPMKRNASVNKTETYSNQKDPETVGKVKGILRRTGQCEQGYDWEKVDGGYRCQGGSHFMSDAAVADVLLDADLDALESNYNIWRRP
ncbi:P-loop containing nucleoside triphosphate hydrolase protein [Triangularia verruculosa]|uniref:P-loop containing nucleoside triphosphate hydrolase protein n=1 Tax=Triangularia verruculosa TaxID=2587418 RepID=A0AAN7B239_9PEZI|nr:P-loop containing nucleoside triphosphate hydrolase protein [Triangularia verruculosa]